MVIFFLLNETKLKEQHKLNFKNYHMVRTDSKYNRGRGTAILIKNNINYLNGFLFNLVIYATSAKSRTFLNE